MIRTSDRVCSISVALAFIGLAVIADMAEARDVKAGSRVNQDALSNDRSSNGKDGELETEHIFGFTEGSDIGDKGELSGELRSISSFDKRFGNYARSSGGPQIKYLPAENFRIGLAANFAYFNISRVPDLDDQRRFAFQGLHIEARYRLLNRATAPFGLTISVEPHWNRFEEVTGEPAAQYGLGFAALFDKELIKGRIFAAFNVLYEPAWTRVNATGTWERESALGFSGAITNMIMPGILLGGEARNQRAYEGAALNTFAGHALFFGPTLCLELSKQAKLNFAWSAQVAGKAVNDPGSLDLVNFERHQIKVLLDVAF